MTPQEQVRQHLIENPEMQRSVMGRTKKDGGYSAALAVRTATGIVVGVLDFENADGVPMTIWAVMEALDTGRSPEKLLCEYVAAEMRALAPEPEATQTRGYRANLREVDFDRKRQQALIQP